MGGEYLMNDRGGLVRAGDFMWIAILGGCFISIG